ncbi:MAG: Ig-like domain-containing protein, partial [Rhodothermales bacterium]|nr:Ig-like domain-containing protein [Rhodothermales bacterium]
MAQRPVEFDVRSNDDLAGVDSVQVVVVSQPRRGTLVQSGGHLVYQSDPGFVGRDSLTYQLSVVPMARMEVDSVASQVTFEASLQIPTIGSSSDQTVFGV